MCEKGRSVLSILHVTVLVYGVAAIVACYFWTSANNDLIPGDESPPYISDLGNHQPQQYFFAASFTIIAAFLIYVSMVRFFQFQWTIGPDEPGIYAMNMIMIILAFVGYVSMIMLAWLNDLTFHTTHDVFSGICFGCLFLYTLLHSAMVWWCYTRRTSIRCKTSAVDEELPFDSKHFYVPTRLWALIWYLLCNAGAMAATVVMSSRFLPFDAGKPQIAEITLVGFFTLYLFPWYWELQNATCRAYRNSRRTGYEPLMMTESTST